MQVLATVRSLLCIESYITGKSLQYTGRIYPSTRLRRSPTEKPTNVYPPLHNGPQLSSSATANKLFRPSSTQTILTRLSPSCRLSDCTLHVKVILDRCSWSLWLAEKNLQATKLCRVLQRLNPTMHMKHLHGELMYAVTPNDSHPIIAAEVGVHVCS